MNIRWLRSNGTLLAFLAVTMVTVGLLATLVVRQQHDQATETGQVYLEKAGGADPPIPVIPADPPQAATGEHGAESTPAPQPVGTDSSDCQNGRYGDGRPCDSSKPAHSGQPTAPLNPPYSNNVTHSNGSTRPEAIIPSGRPGHFDPPAAGADKPVDPGPPRDAGKAPGKPSAPHKPAQPAQPAQPAKPVEPEKPAQPHKPTEPGKSNEQGKAGKPAEGGKPGKSIEHGKPGKPAEPGTGEPGTGEPGKPGKPGGADGADGEPRKSKSSQNR